MQTLVYLCYATKKGHGDQTCIYNVRVTQSNKNTAAILGKSPLRGGFLLPLQSAKTNKFFFSPVVLVLEDLILEVQDPETWDPGIHPCLMAQDLELLSKAEVDFFFHVSDCFIMET